jgi:hypothetical protein
MAKKIKSKAEDAIADGMVLIPEIKVARHSGDEGISMKEFEELLRKNPRVLGDEFD